MYLDRLKRHGPTLVCVVSLTEELAMEQARRADRPVCAEVEGGLFEPDVEAAFVVVFTEEELCTPDQVAASRQVFVGRPGLEVPGTPVFADGTMVLTDMTPAGTDG